MQLLALTVDAHDPARLARFWSNLLGREAVNEPRGVLLPGSDTQVGLRFVPSRTDHTERAERVGMNRVHLHLTSASAADQDRTVATALELGAAHLDVGQRVGERHVVLADPEGNEFCVIESGNAYLAGGGLLGELACDGSREVGLFWAEALGWPLVWDQDQETAIESSYGGTKIAWGGPPVAPKHGRSRQRFDLLVIAADLAAEVDRLIALGATQLGSTSIGVELADPDDNEFCLTAADSRPLR